MATRSKELSGADSDDRREPTARNARTGLPLPELSARRTNTDQIADTLREAILTAAFEDGEELNQVALAKHFGVSRVPIREALRQLQAEGLVTAKAHQRTVVSTLTADRVLEIVNVRVLLETHLLEQAMPKLQASHILQLRELCDEMDGITDHQAWLQKNREFHQKLYASTDAPFTLALLEQLSARIGRYLHRWSATGVERRKEANAEHWAMVRAIEAGDLSKARRELEQHIIHTGDRVADALESSDRTSSTPAEK